MHPLELCWARATSWIYRGDKYLCNLCGFGARRLRRRGHNHPVIVSKQISGAGRRRVDCPKCLSSDRDRLIWKYLKTALPETNDPISSSHINKSISNSANINPTSNNTKTNENGPSQFPILHVAPEIPLSSKLLALQELNFITYQAIDLKTPGYHYPQWVKDADLTELPFADNHFDIIIASHVLEHIPNLHKALQEIHRTLKPSGQAMVMFPVSQNQSTDDYYQPSDFQDNKSSPQDPTRQEKIDRFGQHDHIRLFGTDAAEILSQSNMKVDVINNFNHPGFFGSYENNSLPSNDILFILKKE